MIYFILGMSVPPFLCNDTDLRASHALQLRQAKLSFPSVYLLAGVNSDQDVVTHKTRCVMTQAERYVAPVPHNRILNHHRYRCEAVRHCRWVDEVIPNSPWILDQAFIDKWNIDYVAHDEIPYVSGSHDDVYAFVKAQGLFHFFSPYSKS
jgi:choline-phosphate cytidylyltransferase